MLAGIRMLYYCGNAEQGLVCFTFYNDRAPEARGIIQIWPAWVVFNLNREAATRWCAPLSLDIIDDVTFGEDDEGNFNGRYSTTTDQETQDIVDEDMGIQLDLSAMEKAPEGQERVYLREDDASINTFVTAFGASVGATDTPSQQSGAVTPAGTAAVPVVSGGGAD